MDVALFLALLAVAGQAGIVFLVATTLLARMSPLATDVVLAVRGLLVGRELTLAWVVATTATAGSLYFSEVEHFPPCPLCWYQRIFMYPLVLVLAAAALRRDRAVSTYVLPLVVVGAVFSIYHYQLELFPSQESGFCSTEVPCNIRWVWELGYVSIPLMALTAFVLIAVLLALGRTPTPEPEGDQPWVSKHD